MCKTTEWQEIQVTIRILPCSGKRIVASLRLRRCTVYPIFFLTVVVGEIGYVESRSKFKAKTLTFQISGVYGLPHCRVCNYGGASTEIKQKIG
jgi:hypothetical protein